MARKTWIEKQVAKRERTIRKMSRTVQRMIIDDDWRKGCMVGPAQRVTDAEYWEPIIRPKIEALLTDPTIRHIDIPRKVFANL